jgi:type I restriction enzyme M protein
MAKSEELVRQSFVLHLHQNLGYPLEAMAQEQRVQHGRHSPKTDIVVWESSEKKAQRRSPIIVVECKAENIEIHPRDFYQGESYARAVACEFMVMHNTRKTAYFKLIPGLPGELVQINEVPKAADWGDARRIEAIKNATRAFSRDEFRDLLFKCHSILRDVHKMEPGRAFDAISKTLFIKMFIERTGTWGTFTTDFINRRAETRLPTDPPVHVQLFEQTKRHYTADEIFAANDELEISEDTFRRLVGELERFNLSATGEDIKGLAFEKFLGDTFRGNLGQFFTPRPVVDFMVKLLDPAEGQLICDPAAGSGGFLIAAFEHVRAKIEADVQRVKDAKRAEIEALNLPDEEEKDRINEAFAELNWELDPEVAEPPSRVRKLAHNYMFGTDAEPRAARTAKMNMIMHGDGHGGIHFRDGLLDVNGIFSGRFDLVLTNPPFGSNVGYDQKVGSSEQTRVPEDTEYLRRCKRHYGAAWEVSHARLVAARNKAILELYEIGTGKPNRPTELLFLERCLQLLKPGGRLGIVLPDGNLNNPSLGWLRRWAESKARLLAIVSLPEDTFKSADASVKASLVFLQKFTAEDEAAWEACWEASEQANAEVFARRRDELCEVYSPRMASADDADIRAILEELASLGIRRELPRWRLREPPKYPRGVYQTEIGKPRSEGIARTKEAKNRVRELDKVLKERWTEAVQEQADELLREFRSAMRRIDREQHRAVWAHVREAFDYPVFTAAPETVGITSTGAEGPNQLPEVLEAYRAFRQWLEAGADPQRIPGFAQ